MAVLIPLTEMMAMSLIRPNNVLMKALSTLVLPAIVWISLALIIQPMVSVLMRIVRQIHRQLVPAL